MVLYTTTRVHTQNHLNNLACLFFHSSCLSITSFFSSITPASHPVDPSTGPAGLHMWNIIRGLLMEEIVFLLLISQSFTVSLHAMISLWSRSHSSVELLLIAGRIPELRPIIAVMFCNNRTEVFYLFRRKSSASTHDCYKIFHNGFNCGSIVCL